MKRILEKLPAIVICSITLAVATPSSADPIPYANIGTENPDLYTFTAGGSGSVIAYFVGQSASYGSMIGLSINGAAPLVYGLQNHASAYGEAFNMGTVTAGDTLRFVLKVSFDPDGPPPTEYYVNSEASWNSDGKNYIYSTAFAGDSPIPMGTYVAFEDISPLGGSDLDYNDHQFVFTNLSVTKQSSVPDGASTLALMGIAITGLAAIRRRVVA